MKKSFNTTIRLSADVKQHLDEMKGGDSADRYIGYMLSYFERNGIDPRAVPKGKGGTLALQGIERIIKILRAIEKDKIDKILAVLVPEMRSDENLTKALERIKKLETDLAEARKTSGGASNPEDRRKLAEVAGLIEQSLNPRNFKKADKGTDFFVPPVYFEMLLLKVKNICSEYT